MNAVALVEGEVRELVRRRGLDPYAAWWRRCSPTTTSAVSGGLPQLADRADTARAVFDAVAGFGPLQRWLDDPSVREIDLDQRGQPEVVRRGLL